jgi:hypothetical protein
LRHMARLAVACVPVAARHVWTREGPDASADAAR